MTYEIIISIISAIVSAISAFGGIMVSNKLTTYRIDQLEKKVEKHNNLVVRMTEVEVSCKSAHKRIDGIK